MVIFYNQLTLCNQYKICDNKSQMKKTIAVKRLSLTEKLADGISFLLRMVCYHIQQ